MLSALSQKHGIIPDALLDMTFSQLYLLMADPEEVDRVSRWRQMDDHARDVCREVQRYGYKF